MELSATMIQAGVPREQPVHQVQQGIPELVRLLHLLIVIDVVVATHLLHVVSVKVSAVNYPTLPEYVVEVYWSFPAQVSEVWMNAYCGGCSQFIIIEFIVSRSINHLYHLFTATQNQQSVNGQDLQMELETGVSLSRRPSFKDTIHLQPSKHLSVPTLVKILQCW